MRWRRRRRRAGRLHTYTAERSVAVSFSYVVREREKREGGFSEFTCWSDRPTDVRTVGLEQRRRQWRSSLSSAVSRPTDRQPS